MPGALKGSLQGGGNPGDPLHSRLPEDAAETWTDLQRASGSSIRNPGKLDGVRLSGNKKEFS